MKKKEKKRQQQPKTNWKLNTYLFKKKRSHIPTQPLKWLFKKQQQQQTAAYYFLNMQMRMQMSL